MGRRFESYSGSHGALVKWLRHRPFTAASRVRIPYASPFDYTGMYLSPVYWALSSAGRASALQAEGQRFDPVSAHHYDGKGHPLGWPFLLSEGGDVALFPVLY